MWKEYAKEVKKNIFLHISDTNSIYHPKIIKAGLKTRPTDEDGVLKTNKMYEIKLSDLKPIILEWVKDHKADKASNEDLPEILGIKDRMVFFREDCLATWTIYNNGYCSWNPGWDNDWLDDESRLTFALFSEMKEVEKNAEEQKRLEAKQLSQRKVNLNSLVVKDNLLAAFKKAGFELDTYDAGKTYRIKPQDDYAPATSYNEFIETAIEFYINEGIAKDLGCKIHIAKVSRKNGHREPYDDIIDMEQIDIEGEQNGCQEA